MHVYKKRNIIWFNKNKSSMKLKNNNVENGAFAHSEQMLNFLLYF